VASAFFKSFSNYSAVLAYEGTNVTPALPAPNYALTTSAVWDFSTQTNNLSPFLYPISTKP